MNNNAKYIIYCRQFGNIHDDFIYKCEDLDSAKEIFRRTIKEYHEHLCNLGLHINKIIYEGPRTKKEAEECLPLVIFITDDKLWFEVEMVEARRE